MPTYCLLWDITHACRHTLPTHAMSISTAPSSPSCHCQSCSIMAVRQGATKTQQTNSLTSGDKGETTEDTLLSALEVLPDFVLSHETLRTSCSWIWSCGGVVQVSFYRSKRFALWQFSQTFSGLFFVIILCFPARTIFNVLAIISIGYDDVVLTKVNCWNLGDITTKKSDRAKHTRQSDKLLSAARLFEVNLPSKFD